MKIATIILALLLLGITFAHPFVSLATMGAVVALARPAIDRWIRRRDYLPCLIAAFIACLFTNSIVWGVQQKPRDIQTTPTPSATPLSPQTISAIINYKEPEEKERPADNPHASGPGSSAASTEADQRQRELLDQVHGVTAGNAASANVSSPVPVEPIEETVCVDGTKTTATGRGACAHHGGVLYGR